LARGIISLTTLFRALSAGWHRSTYVLVFVGALITIGCDSGDTVLPIPEGGTVNPPPEAGKSTFKANPNAKVSSRRERLEKLEKEGSK
jgi:hypothetical protein